MNIVSQSGMFVSRTSSIKIDVFRVREEDIRTEGRRIRTLSKHWSLSIQSLTLWKIEILHQPDTSFACPSNTTKKFSYIVYIVCIIVIPLCFDKLLLIVYGMFSCLSIANTQATCSNEQPRPLEVPDRLCHPTSVALSNTRAIEGLIDQLA